VKSRREIETVNSKNQLKMHSWLKCLADVVGLTSSEGYLVTACVKTVIRLHVACRAYLF